MALRLGSSYLLYVVSDMQQRGTHAEYLVLLTIYQLQLKDAQLPTRNYKISPTHHCDVARISGTVMYRTDVRLLLRCCLVSVLIVSFDWGILENPRKPRKISWSRGRFKDTYLINRIHAKKQDVVVGVNEGRRYERE